MKIESTESNIVCFSADTSIDLADGSHVPIANIRVGNSILAYDQGSRGPLEVQVETIASSFHMRHAVLSLEDGTKLTCTDDHPLWVDNKGWCVVEPRKAAKNYGLTTKHLSSGDKLLVLRDGALKTVRLVNITSIIRPTRMWVIGTGKNHTFFANGVLAHDENIGSLDLSRIRGVIVEKFDERLYTKPALV
uniref:Intein N-terminal splicing region n=1 Tax=Candidatus Kentrum sp. TUN TaxID=2126343 RepID=A0A451AKP3_9GAMM|nr:MAG: intein N-terminal splicing region [Candidatus Kentron sp. TUN]VFK66599.1 MAG: intein N-terminal splicing region [Candidatus Kentron sp. TUN]